MASHLFLPSPACQSHLGQPTGYVDRQGNPTIVDPHGDVVMSTSLCHDTWRTRHNDVQRALVAKAYEARVEVEAEVIGLFRQQIPEQAFNQGGELESCRQRNGCIPDLLLGFPVPLDPRPGVIALVQVAAQGTVLNLSQLLLPLDAKHPLGK